MGFVGNLRLFLAVKGSWKFVKNWQSYRHEFVVLHFWDTVYHVRPMFYREVNVT